ncbi:hypothetical protein [Sphingomonas sp. GB1N7]|uniref:hypothetical protein n=1 Tax=Parasphingomonas caseinilytica TaxID=3096158 RepID=UPI002FCA176B
MKTLTKKLALAALSATVVISPTTAQRTPPPIPAPAPPPPYALYADFVLDAPVIVDAAIRSTSRIKGADAATVPPGLTRFYVEADVLALIRGPAALPPRIGYLLDVRPDARGKLPNLRKLRVLLFARPVAGSGAQIQLVRPDAMRDWTPAADALARRITTETLAADAPPKITGLGNSFHTTGALPGEGETQIFLTTAAARPVSLSITTKPAGTRHWAVSLSDVVSDSAVPPARDTLLWYRLACFLPPALPETAAPEAAEDYRFVLDSLGPCDRGNAAR